MDSSCNVKVSRVGHYSEDVEVGSGGAGGGETEGWRGGGDSGWFVGLVGWRRCEGGMGITGVGGFAGVCIVGGFGCGVFRGLVSRPPARVVVWFCYSQVWCVPLCGLRRWERWGVVLGNVDVAGFLRVERKLFVIEQPISLASPTDSEYLRSGMRYMIHNKELKSMFEKQAGVEWFDLIQTFHACKQDEGKPVGPYCHTPKFHCSGRLDLGL
ncbi:hypothetical protein Tco_1209865 [Tanacetum coccineum]